MQLKDAIKRLFFRPKKKVLEEERKRKLEPVHGMLQINHALPTRRRTAAQPWRRRPPSRGRKWAGAGCSASSSCTTTTTPPPSSSAPPAESTPTEGEGARRAWPWPWSPAGAAGGHGTAGEGEIGEEICSTGSHTAGRGMDAAEERKNKEIRSRSRRNKAASACSRGASSGSLSSPRSGGRRGRLQIGRRERSPSLILYGRRDYATRNKQMPRCVEKVAGSCSGKKIELLARIGEK